MCVCVFLAGEKSTCVGARDFSRIDCETHSVCFPYLGTDAFRYGVDGCYMQDFGSKSSPATSLLPADIE